MKKIFTAAILGFLFSASGLKAQNYTIEPGKVINVATNNSDMFDAEVKFKNLLGSNIIFSWELIENNIPAAWDYSICDFDNCYTGIPDSSDMSPVDPDQYGFLKLTIIPNQITTSGTAKFLVYEKGTAKEDGDTILFNITTLSTSLSKISAVSPVKTYPNPVKDVLNLDFESSSAKTVEIFNAKGEKVWFLGNTSLKNLSLETASWTPGVYLVRVTGDNGVVHSGGKFLKID